MAYYIISFAPVAMKKFQEKNLFLNRAVWIKDKNQLLDLTTSPNDVPVFFVHFSTIHQTALSDLVITVRSKWETAKVLYVLDDIKAFDLKSHQLTPVGGDAYIQIQIETERLLSMIEDFNPHMVRKEKTETVDIQGMQDLKVFKSHTQSLKLDQLFSEHLLAKPFTETTGTKSGLAPFGATPSGAAKLPATTQSLQVPEAGDPMSDKDQELSLDDLGDLELSDDDIAGIVPLEEEGMELKLEEGTSLEMGSLDDLTLGGAASTKMDLDMDLGEISLGDADSGATETKMDLSFEEVPEEPESTRMDLVLDDALLDNSSESTRMDISLDDGDLGESTRMDIALDNSESTRMDINLDDDFSLSLDESDGDELSLSDEAVDLSDDAMKKLREIDAIMDSDASDINISVAGLEKPKPQTQAPKKTAQPHDRTVVTRYSNDDDSDLDTSLVSDDLDLGSLNFSSEEKTVIKAIPLIEQKIKRPGKKEVRDDVDTTYQGNLGKDLKELSHAYSGEMERMQATVANLREDREELLAKIQKLEEDRMSQNRQTLTMRAELDEKKIELSIIRKKLNDEIAELKDRLKLYEEKKLILEEKYKILTGELDKVSQKNKFDVKKVQMREKELEQKLELLKADSETQIRHRDLKILELKRKLDAMEFDIESISVQEKRSVESRFELEDKLGKAIKTLRNAITVLEDESDKTNVLEALKKNIDM